MRYFITIFFWMLSSLPILAQDGDAERGRDLFARNCAVCHGDDATGGGPMTAILSVSPPDLTALSFDGLGFHPAEAARKIDGRDLISHGGPMPLFGSILEDRSAVLDDRAGTPVFTSAAVVDIVAWLESIQR